MRYLRKCLWERFPDNFYNVVEEKETGALERRSRLKEGLPIDVPPIKAVFHRLCTFVAFSETEGTPRRYQETVYGPTICYDDDIPPVYPMHIITVTSIKFGTTAACDPRGWITTEVFTIWFKKSITFSGATRFS